MASAQPDADRGAAALAKLQTARAALVLGDDTHDAGTFAFFASLALRLKLEQRDDVGTMATDGRCIWFAPDYVEPLTDWQAISEVCHETGHCWLQHPARLVGLLGTAPDAAAVRRAQIAADCALDPLLRDAGFWNPPGAVFPADYGLPEGETLEWYFRHLPPDAAEDPSSDPGRGKVQPATGEDGAPDAAAAEASAAEWEVATQQALETAKQRGGLPDCIGGACDALTRHAVDWRDVLREFLAGVSRDDYSWTPPNRRHIGAGLYLPACRAPRIGRLVVMLDTSGSMSSAAVAGALGELEAVLAARPLAVDVLLHTTAIWRHVAVDLEAGDEMPALEIKRGGTRHADCFAWLEREAPDALAVLAFTDLESDLDEIRPPACPVLFFAPDGSNLESAPAWAAAVASLPDA